MNLKDTPETTNEQAVVDAIHSVFTKLDKNRDLYPEDMVHFSTSEAPNHQIAVVQFDRFPSIPATEFGSGVSRLQMKERFEEQLLQELPDNIRLERNSRKVFGFFTE